MWEVIATYVWIPRLGRVLAEFYKKWAWNSIIGQSPSESDSVSGRALCQASDNKNEWWMSCMQDALDNVIITLKVCLRELVDNVITLYCTALVPTHDFISLYRPNISLKLGFFLLIRSSRRELNQRKWGHTDVSSEQLSLLHNHWRFRAGWAQAKFHEN